MKEIVQRLSHFLIIEKKKTNEFIIEKEEIGSCDLGMQIVS